MTTLFVSLSISTESSHVLSLILVHIVEYYGSPNIHSTIIQAILPCNNAGIMGVARVRNIHPTTHAILSYNSTDIAGITNNGSVT